MEPLEEKRYISFLWLALRPEGRKMMPWRYEHLFLIMAEDKRQKAYVADIEREFLAAYEAHADALFRHCLLRVRDRDAARDIVQETFSRTWVYLSEGKTVEHIRAFLYRVANNLIVDGSRKKKSSSLDAMMEDDGFEVRDESLTDPSEKQSIREALAALKELDEIYRTAITMRYLDELTPKEIAAALGVTENVVSVRIHRGVEKLAKAMRRERAVE